MKSPITDWLDETLKKAIRLQKAGQLDDAQSLYINILQKVPTHPDALHLLGMISFDRRDFDKAADYIQQAINVYPNQCSFYNNLGNVYNEAGRLSDAISAYQHALKLDPDYVDAKTNLGIAFADSHRYKEAILCFEDVIQNDPAHLNAYLELGKVLRLEGHLDEAIFNFQKCLTLDYSIMEAHEILGQILLEKKDYKGAEDHFQKVRLAYPQYGDIYKQLAYVYNGQGKKAKALSMLTKAAIFLPDQADIYHQLGIACYENKKFSEAIHYYQKAIHIKPDSFQTYNNLGNIFLQKNQFIEAQKCYQEAIRIHPQYDFGHHHLGSIYLKTGRIDKAIFHLKQAIKINPELVDAHYHLGDAFRSNKKLGAAKKCYEQVLKMCPSHAKAMNNLGLIYLNCLRLETALDWFKKSIKTDPFLLAAHSNQLLSFHYDQSQHPKDLYEAALFFGKCVTSLKDKNADHPMPNKVPNKKGAPLRVGYISADFRAHSVGYFALSLIRAHERAHVTVYCYSDVQAEDQMTDEFKLAADHWIPIKGLSDDQVFNRIHQDEIDILVDLAGHTHGNRLPVFSRKPALTQVSWLGYADTTGLSQIDFRITDKYTDPEEKSQEFYTETLFRLPGFFLCYHPPKDAPNIEPLPFHKNRYITFGSFNNVLKVNKLVIEVWSHILQKVPNSRLVMKFHQLRHDESKQQIQDHFIENGIKPNRLVLMADSPTQSDHLAHYNEIDIALDPFPYNGTTTTFEALWMGIPVITLKGKQHAGRVGYGILKALEKDAWIATNTDEYIQLAINLANDNKRLDRIRSHLRSMLAKSVLCNAKQFANQMENAFVKMHELKIEKIDAARVYLDQADHYEREKQYHLVIPLLKLVLAEKGPTSVLLNRMGKNYEHLGHFAQAIHSYQDSLELDDAQLDVFRKLEQLQIAMASSDTHILPSQHKSFEYQLFGDNSCGWDVISDVLDENAIVYCFGCGENISFDLDLIKKIRCRVYGFDPTPRSIDYVQSKMPLSHYTFFDYGLANFDGTTQFHPPVNPDHVSHTILNRSIKVEGTIEVPMKRLKTIMALLDHDHLDLIKMDIEGAEYNVISDILKENIQIGQILVEFHHFMGDVDFKKTVMAITHLTRAGYVLYALRQGTDFCFIHNSLLKINKLRDQ